MKRLITSLLCAITFSLGACADESPGYPPIVGDTDSQLCCGAADPNGDAGFLICKGDDEWPDECVNFDPNGETDSIGGTMGSGAISAGSDGGGVDDSSGGGACGAQGRLTCQGWIAGIYKAKSASVNPRWKFDFHVTPANPAYPTYAEPVTIDLCIPMLEEGKADTEMRFEACQNACETLVANGDLPQNGPYPTYPIPGSVGELWDFQGVACRFASASDSPPNYQLPIGTFGSTGVISATLNSATNFPEFQHIFPDGTLDAGDCSGTGCAPQNIYHGCVEDGACEVGSEACVDWVPGLTGNQTPGPSIATATNTTTKVVTTSLLRMFLSTQMANLFDRVYACDGVVYPEGLYLTGAALGTAWKFAALSAGDFWYEMGQRTGDHLKQIRYKTGATTYSAWFSLERFSDNLTTTPIELGALEAYMAIESSGATALEMEFTRKIGVTTYTYVNKITLL